MYPPLQVASISSLCKLLGSVLIMAKELDDDFRSYAFAFIVRSIRLSVDSNHPVYCAEKGMMMVGSTNRLIECVP